SQPHIRGHQRAKHGAHMDVSRASAQQPGQAKSYSDHQEITDAGKDHLRSSYGRLPEEVVHNPGSEEEAKPDRDPGADWNVSDAVIHERAAQVIDNGKQEHAADPGHGGFPSEPVQLPGEYRCDLPLFNNIKAPAVNHPDSPRRVVFVSGLLRRRQSPVQPGEEVGLANPKDPCEYMDPAYEKLEPFAVIELNWAMRRAPSRHLA